MKFAVGSGQENLGRAVGELGQNLPAGAARRDKHIVIGSDSDGDNVPLPVHRRQVTGEFLAPHYLRFVVNDKPGIVSGIAGALARVGANIDSLLQRPGYPKHSLPFVITTEPCLTSTIEKAVAAIAKMDSMLERPLCLQILTIDDKAE